MKPIIKMNKQIRLFLTIALLLLLSSAFYSVKLHFDIKVIENQNHSTKQENDSLLKENKQLIIKSDADELFLEAEYTAAFKLYSLLDRKDTGSSILQKRENYSKKYNKLKQKANEDLVVVRVDSSTNKLLASQIESLKTIQKSTNDSLITTYKNKIQVLKSALAVKPSLKELSFYSIHGTKTTYFGEVVNNKANGEGMGYYRSGNVYIGTWNNNLKDGESGIYYFLNGDRYEGDYSLDRREGYGTYFWASGDRYVGQWFNDKRNGFGVLYDSNNKEKMKGTWKNDELVSTEE